MTPRVVSLRQGPRLRRAGSQPAPKRILSQLSVLPRRHPANASS
jgi:hypothetical protein